MLKIKDNVDLKELEKFGFKKERDEDYRNETLTLDYIINGKNKEICIASTYGEYDELDNTLYDLIKADLVEKVEEE